MKYDFANYDCGLISDYGGGDVSWWQDYIRAEIDRANEFWWFQSEEAYASQKAEIERLRAVISKCADALGNGAYIAPTASVEFMERLPLETSMRIAALSETSNGKD